MMDGLPPGGSWVPGKRFPAAIFVLAIASHGHLEAEEEVPVKSHGENLLNGVESRTLQGLDLVAGYWKSQHVINLFIYIFYTY